MLNPCRYKTKLKIQKIFFIIHSVPNTYIYPIPNTNFYIENTSVLIFKKMLIIFIEIDNTV